MLEAVFGAASVQCSNLLAAQPSSKYICEISAPTHLAKSGMMPFCAVMLCYAVTDCELC